MDFGMTSKISKKANPWFTEPLGVLKVPDSAETELITPVETSRVSMYQTKRKKGRGDRREIPYRIEEFHPRDAAGRREVRGTTRPNKAVMPRRGSRTKFP